MLKVTKIKICAVILGCHPTYAVNMPKGKLERSLNTSSVKQLSKISSTVQHMYQRYKGPSDGQYSVCTVEPILDNYFPELIFCGLSCFPLWLHHLLTLLTLWKEMEIVEKEGTCLFFDTDIPFFFFFPNY